MNDIRIFIQSKLNEITLIDSGTHKPDDVVPDGVTYFGYTVQESYVGSDFDKNYTMQASINGFAVRRELDNEDTLEILDNAVSEIKKVLKDMNFKYTVMDASLDNGMRKFTISGYAVYNEKNRKFIV